MVEARSVIFVDAAEDCGEVEVRPVAPRVEASSLGHALDPGQVLGVARSLYSVDVPAWLVRVPATQFEVGTEVSALTQQGIRDACHLILKLARQGGSQASLDD